MEKHAIPQMLEEQEMSPDQVVVSALGRPFALGMFYDARKDELLPGLPMWDIETLKQSTRTKPKHSSEFYISTSDSTEQKTSLLNVDCSLKLSFISGLVNVRGSAKYLNNSKRFKNQSRVTLQYKSTTHFAQLSVTSKCWENIQNREIIDKGLATHVVTGIEYGANAFFVFDSEKVEASEVLEVQGKMEAVIKKIPMFEISGTIDAAQLNDEEEDLVKSSTCTFFGDFILQNNPVTFSEAIQVYVDLPNLLENGKNTVPVKVWMMPVYIFRPKAPQIVKEISIGTVMKAANSLDDLSSIKMRCNDCMTISAVGKFPQLHEQLKTFNNLCHYYTIELQRQMAETCPAIRAGTEPESVLRSIFDQRDLSPFSQVRLTQWLDDKEREIIVVQACLDIMDVVPVLSTQAELERFVLSPGDDIRWGFIFTSLRYTDLLLEDMGRCLDTLKLRMPFEQPRKTLDVPWYYSDEIVSNMRLRATNCSRLRNEASVIIAAEESEDLLGAATYKYQNGSRVAHWGIKYADLS